MLQSQLSKQDKQIANSKSASSKKARKQVQGSVMAAAPTAPHNNDDSISSEDDSLEIYIGDVRVNLVNCSDGIVLPFVRLDAGKEQDVLTVSDVTSSSGVRLVTRACKNIFENKPFDEAEKCTKCNKELMMNGFRCTRCWYQLHKKCIHSSKGEEPETKAVKSRQRCQKTQQLNEKKCQWKKKLK